MKRGGDSWIQCAATAAQRCGPTGLAVKIASPAGQQCSRRSAQLANNKAARGSQKQSRWPTSSPLHHSSSWETGRPTRRHRPSTSAACACDLPAAPPPFILSAARSCVVRFFLALNSLPLASPSPCPLSLVCRVASSFITVTHPLPSTPPLICASTFRAQGDLQPLR